MNTLKHPFLLASDGNIFTVGVDGTGKTYLTADGAGYENNLAAWSHDGSKIVYARQAPNDFPYIWTMNADGSDKRQLTFGALHGSTPSFSPDGGSILFTGYGTHQIELWAMNADGTNARPLTATTGSQVARSGAIQQWSASGSYSPDGKKIAYASTQSGRAQIWVMNADGSGQTQLTFPDDPDSPDANAPSWAPDGSKIVFWSGFVRETGNIHTINADGSGRTRLTSGNGADGITADDPYWTADGKHILFDSNLDGGAYATWIMNPDGTDQRQLLPVAFGGSRRPLSEDAAAKYGVSDLLMTNHEGTLVVGHIAGGSLTFHQIGALGGEWELAGSGFLLGPGRPGFLIRSSDGRLAVGEVENGNAVFTAVPGLGCEWEFAGNADFLGDGQSQFLMRNDGPVANGTLVIGEIINGITNFTAIGGIGREWRFAGNGDFVGDGREEFLIRNTDGALAIGEVVNGVADFTAIGGLCPEWTFAGVGDFLGRGHDGFLIVNTGTMIGGALAVGEVVDDTVTFTNIGGVGPEWQFIGTGDYSGDSSTDFALRNTVTGELAIGSAANGTADFTRVAAVGAEWNFHSGNPALLPRG